MAAGIAAVAGFLAHASGDSIAKSLLTSGRAFATTLGVLLAGPDGLNINENCGSTHARLAYFSGGR